MFENDPLLTSGRKPEQLPQEKELPIIKKALKMTAKEMKKIDK